MLNESWRRPQTQHVPLRANIASHQLCREKQPLWKSHDGLNPICLDQCHGVRSLGTSSSQGWRKGIVIQIHTVYSLNLIHEFTSLFRRSDFCRFAKESLPTEVGKGRHWTSVFFCGCPSNTPRFAQGQPNGYFQMKKLDRTTEPIARKNVE